MTISAEAPSHPPAFVFPSRQRKIEFRQSDYVKLLDEDRDEENETPPPPSVLKGIIIKGRYLAGQWYPWEHQAFLKGLTVYGRSWKRIAKMIPSRSPTQIRSHAQKYFAKLEEHFTEHFWQPQHHHEAYVTPLLPKTTSPSAVTNTFVSLPSVPFMRSSVMATNLLLPTLANTNTVSPNNLVATATPPGRTTTTGFSFKSASSSTTATVFSKRSHDTNHRTVKLPVTIDPSVAAANQGLNNTENTQANGRHTEERSGDSGSYCNGNDLGRERRFSIAQPSFQSPQPPPSPPGTTGAVNSACDGFSLLLSASIRQEARRIIQNPEDVPREIESLLGELRKRHAYLQKKLERVQGRDQQRKPEEVFQQVQQHKDSGSSALCNTDAAAFDDNDEEDCDARCVSSLSSASSASSISNSSTCSLSSLLSFSCLDQREEAAVQLLKLRLSDQLQSPTPCHRHLRKVTYCPISDKAHDIVA